jgi:hypothetical protein
METVWELTVEKRGEGAIIATRHIESVTIRCGSEVWVVEKVTSAWTGEVEAVRVRGPAGADYRPRTKTVRDIWALVEDVIGYMARTRGGPGTADVAAALGPENPRRSELLRQLFATGRARIAKRGSSG